MSDISGNDCNCAEIETLVAEVELRGSVLCAIAFDLGRSFYIRTVDDGLDIGGFLNVATDALALSFDRQQRVVEVILGTMAGFCHEAVEAQLIHPSVVAKKRRKAKAAP